MGEAGAQAWAPWAGPAPGSHTRCSHMGSAVVCRVEPVLGWPNPEVKGSGQVGDEGAKSVDTGLVVDAAAVGAGDAVGTAAVCAVAVGPELQLLSQSGLLVPALHLGSVGRLSAFVPGPAVSSAAAVETKSHRWGSIGWWASHYGSPSPTGGPA